MRCRCPCRLRVCGRRRRGSSGTWVRICICGGVTSLSKCEDFVHVEEEEEEEERDHLVPRDLCSSKLRNACVERKKEITCRLNRIPAGPVRFAREKSWTTCLANRRPTAREKLFIRLRRPSACIFFLRGVQAQRLLDRVSPAKGSGSFRPSMRPKSGVSSCSCSRRSREV